MHTAELGSTVGCTQRSLTLWWDGHSGLRLIQKCKFFMFLYVLRLSTPFFRKTSEVKKILEQFVAYSINFILISLSITEK